MIEIRNLIKQYEDFTLRISLLHINRGESIGIAGNNGAGKTTFLNLMLDLIPANKGEILIQGKKVAFSDHWKKYTGSYLNEGFLIDFLTPLEYLNFVGSLYDFSQAEVEKFIEDNKDFVDTDIIYSGKLIRTLSTGNRSKLGILTTILSAEELLILDEPFAHLDPSSQIKLKEMLVSLNKNKKITMLISSHDLKHLAEISTRIIILEDGTIKKDMITSTETLRDLEHFFGVK